MRIEVSIIRFAYYIHGNALEWLTSSQTHFILGGNMKLLGINTVIGFRYHNGHVLQSGDLNRWMSVLQRWHISCWPLGLHISLWLDDALACVHVLSNYKYMCLPFVVCTFSGTRWWVTWQRRPKCRQEVTVLFIQRISLINDKLQCLYFYHFSITR